MNKALNKKKITLTTEVYEDQEKQIKDRIKWFEDESDYLNYLLELDLTISGTDDITCGLTSLLEEMVKKSPKESGVDIKTCSQIILSCLEAIIDSIPEKSRMFGEDGNKTYWVPEDDNIGTALYYAKLLKELINKNEEKEK